MNVFDSVDLTFIMPKKDSRFLSVFFMVVVVLFDFTNSNCNQLNVRGVQRLGGVRVRFS